MAAHPLDPRLDQLKVWVSGLGPSWPVNPDSCTPASADASFRRYFRATTSHPEYPTVIVMDAPPAQEDCRPFIHVAELFGAAGVTVPRVLAQDLEQGIPAAERPRKHHLPVPPGRWQRAPAV
ncbi:phosphotransferase [Cupriavidus basilensis]